MNTTMQTLWSGCLESTLDPAAWEFNSSLRVDQRLARQDVRASRAWADALRQAGVLTAEECRQLQRGLQTIDEEFACGWFQFQPWDEDIHTAVERRLGELAGPVAGKLHTGRSRNDQVATDFRLWLLEQLPLLQDALAGLQAALTERAALDQGLLMPGYTHLQRAQPVLLSHWWLSWFWPLQRDRQRLREMRGRTGIMPLGSGALSGVAFPVDREQLARELGFLAPSENSLDGVADRDFAAEFLFAVSLAAIHLSRLAEGVILFSSSEFGFFELSDAYATGSSLMPQKKNPDVFELARGKAGTLLGRLTGFLAVLKGLPSAYDKDLQEDKAPVFEAFDTLLRTLEVLAGAVRSMRVIPENLARGLDPGLLATELADYLVEKGVPFREAHGVAGRAVRLAQAQLVKLDRLPLEDFQSLHPAFAEDVYRIFDPGVAAGRRQSCGGTSPAALVRQLEQARQLLETGPAPVWR